MLGVHAGRWPGHAFGGVVSDTTNRDFSQPSLILEGAYTVTTIPAHAQSPFNRRTAIAGAGLAAALAILGQVGRAAAQAVDYSRHPLCGTWLAMANPPMPEDPKFPAPSLFAADGTVLLVFPATQRGPAGVDFGSAVMGTWAPDGDRRGHFTAVQLMSDAEGRFTGSLTIDGYPEVSDDGQSFLDDGSRAMLTFRDASGAVVNQIMPNGSPAGPGVQAVRMGVGIPGLVENGTIATPES